MAFETNLDYLRTLANHGVEPVDSSKDAVEKFRVSNPQSLIDTDFEYSLQSSKWEFLTTSNNYPGVYARANEPAFSSSQITSILPTGPDNKDVEVTVNIVPRIPFRTGDSIVIKDSLNTTFVDGAYVITEVPSQFKFIITTKSPVALVGDQKTPYTALFTGGLFSNVNIPINKITSIAGTSAAIIDFKYPHGLFKNSPIIIADPNQPTARYCGTFNINTILSETSATYITNVTSPFPTTTQIVPASGLVYARTEGIAVHRYFDGGVQINPGTSAPNAQILRQTRKYFKYQSGKSVQFSTGILFLPVYEINKTEVDTVQYNNSQFVSKIIISGVEDSSNGTYERDYDIDSSYQTNQSTVFYGPSSNQIYLSGNGSDTQFWTLWDSSLSANTYQNTSTPISSISVGNWVQLEGTLAVDLTAVNTVSRGYNFYDFIIDTVQFHGFSKPDEYRESAYIETVGFELSAPAPRNPYNGFFPVSEVVNAKQFKVRLLASDNNPFPTSILNPGGIGLVRVKSFNDATVRSGLFDEQNGIFFEYDGKDLYVVKRQSTTPLAGTVTATLGNPLLSSFDGNCRFKSQLTEGDFIVIMGQSYLVNKIIDDNNLNIAPYYRGPTINSVVVNKTEELRTRQKDFNLDKLDGTGPSGYVVDLNRMQMIFIDYSWYGAGKIRYGIRSNKGKIIYFHEIYNNNVNSKAYMRTGNVPGRFEITSRSKRGKIKNNIESLNNILPTIASSVRGIPGTKNVEFKISGDYSTPNPITVFDISGLGNKTSLAIGTFNPLSRTYNAGQNITTVRYEIESLDEFGSMPPNTTSNITVFAGASQNVLRVSEEDAYYLPGKGRLIVKDEYIDYEKGSKFKENIDLIIKRRNANGLLSVPSINENDSYLSFNQNCSPALSHWGVAALIDGGFNEDKSYLFTGASDGYLIADQHEAAVLSIRLAPSVDYGITAPFGVRNLINHSSMRLKSIGIVTTNPVQIFIRLNCDSTLFRTSSGWQPGGNGSIAQYWDHTTSGTFPVSGTGGDLIGSFFLAPGTPATTTYRDPTYISQDYDIEVVRDLGNSIIGGNFVYPDGPDILTLSVKTFEDYKALTRARVSWTEDQG